MLLRKCDGCGKEWKFYGETSDLYEMRFAPYTHLNRVSEISSVDYDVCPECKKKILSMMKGGDTND